MVLYSRTLTGKEYTVRYVNGSSGTNVTFANSKIAWYSSDNGASWSQASFTPDIFTTEIESMERFVSGYYAEDVYGLTTQDFNANIEIIEGADLPMTYPSIGWYNSSFGVLDYDLNGTYAGNMSFKIYPATKPSSLGGGYNSKE